MKIALHTGTCDRNQNPSFQPPLEAKIDESIIKFIIHKYHFCYDRNSICSTSYLISFVAEYLHNYDNPKLEYMILSTKANHNIILILIASAVEIALVWLLVLLNVCSRRRGLISTLVLFILVGITIFVVYFCFPLAFK